MEHRIYKEKITISNPKDFWNARAAKYDPENPYVSTRLNDKNPTYSTEYDLYEKQFILPKLELDATCNVLDIGCGVGRMTDCIAPVCKLYIGTDYAEELVKIAQQRFPSDGNIKFVSCSFQELCAKKIECAEPFDRVIISGVSMYINDDELEQCFQNLLSLLSKKCVLYIAESVSFEKRLTLCDFYSEDLESTYNVIYRTQEEYQKFFECLFRDGFLIRESDFFTKKYQRFSETYRYYWIMYRE